MGRCVVHREFWSKNPDKVSQLYASVYDREINFMPETDYQLVETGHEGEINGGIMTPQVGPWPGTMDLHMDVDDRETNCFKFKIKKAGRKILVDRREMAGVGALFLVEDPDGRVLGLWKQ